MAFGVLRKSRNEEDWLFNGSDDVDDARSSTFAHASAANSNFAVSAGSRHQIAALGIGRNHVHDCAALVYGE
jgi:hypothetical protein